MKLRNFYFLFALSLLGYLFLSNSSGRATSANDGNTGAPGESGTVCGTCHAGGGGTFGVLSEVLEVRDAGGTLVTEYMPNETYSVTLTITTSTGTPGGYAFQMTSLEDAGNAEVGSWQNVGANVKIATAANIAGGRTYVEHNGGVSASNTFSMEWVAPAAGTGAVSLYYVGNAVNGTGSTGGDLGGQGSVLSLSELVPPPVCGAQFLDSGGAAATYSANESSTTTLCPDNPGDAITVTFTFVDIESAGTLGTQGCWDFLSIYDGGDNTATALAAVLCGELDGDGNTPGTATSLLQAGDSFTATNASGCLTIDFSSDVSGQDEGYIADVTCAPPPACPAPTELATANITASSAELSWMESGTATLWDIELVDLTAGGTATGNPTTTGVSNPYTQGGLSGLNEYAYYVRADCGIDGPSAWTGPINFTTLCGAINPPSIEEFTTFLPDCWDEATDGDPVTGPTGLGAGSWTSNDFGNNGSSDAAAINLFSDAKSDWLLSPEYDLSAGGPWQLIFDIAVTTFSGTASSPFGSDDEVQLLVTTDGVTWVNLLTWDVTSTVSNTGEEVIVDLSAYNGTVQFAFWATEGTVNDTEDYYFYVDNFEVRTPPSCADITGLNVSNITATSASIGWTAGGTETSWEVAVLAAGTAPTSGTTTADNPYTVMGLMETTDYDVYVRAICGPGDTSEYVGPVAFTTPCTPLTPPALEEFTTFLPDCWDEATNGDPSTGPTGLGAGSWTSNDFGNNGSSDAAAINLFSDAKSDWLLSPNYDLSAGGPWQLVFDIAVTTFSGTASSPFGSDDEVQLLVTTDGVTWVNLLTWDVTSTVSNTGEEIIVDLSAYNGTVQFAFWATEGTVNDTEDYYFYVDNFIIRTPPSCADITGINVSNITATTASIGWTAGGTETSWEVAVLAAGTAPTSGTTTADNPYTAMGLMETSDYDVYVRAICGPGDTSDYVGPVSFTTPCASIIPPALEEFTTFLPDCWNEATSGDPATGPTGLGAGSWLSNDFGNNGSSDAAAINLYSDFNSDWLLSPNYDLSAGGPWQLVFDIAVTTFSGTATSPLGSDDEVQLLVTTDGGATWINLMTWDATSSVSNTGETILVDLAAYTGTVQFAFWGTDGTVDDSQDYYFYVDNFEIRTPPACSEVSSLTATNITSSSADLGWTANGTETTWNVELQLAGTTPTGTGFGTTNNPTIASGLMENTDYEFYVQANCGPANLMITATFDGPLTGGNPKGVELYVVNDIGDMSKYGLGSANNGGGTDGQEFTFPAIAVSAGTYIYVASNAAGFMDYFGFAADYTSGAMSINGDDAVELFEDGVVIDLFGDINLDGTGEAWDHLDGWAYRNSGLAANNGAFDANNWTFSGPDALDPCSTETNATCASMIPIGTFTGAMGELSAWAGPFAFTTLCGPVLGDSLQTPIVVPSLPYADTSSTAACYTNQGFRGSVDVYYQFTTGPCTNAVTISTCNPGTNFDTYIHLLDSAGVEIAFNDDGAVGSCSDIDDQAVDANTTYYVVVEAFFTADVGDFELTIVPTEADLMAGSKITNISCNGESDGMIALAPTGGVAPYTFNWDNGAITADISGLTGGTYSVTVTDANGCSSTAGLEVTNPDPIAAVIDVLANVSCNGADDGGISITTTGGTAPYTYLWSNGATTEDLLDLAPGNYTNTITDFNRCILVTTTTITQPQMLTGNDDVTAVSCNGGSDGAISIGISGGTTPYTYLWNNGDTTDNPTGLSAGNYTGTITDANGCTLASPTITVDEPTAIASSLATSNVTCNGAADGSIILTATGGTLPYSYLWSNGATTQNLSDIGSAIYSATITDANGCTAMTTAATITEPAVLEVALTPTDETVMGANDGIISAVPSGGTSPYAYDWDNGENTATIAGLAPGTYCVVITDDNGCMVTACAEVMEGPVATQEIKELDEITLSPNPTSGQARLELTFVTAVDLELEVINTLGQIITTQRGQQVLNANYTIELNDYPSGIYFVKISVGDKFAVKRLVVSE